MENITKLLNSFGIDVMKNEAEFKTFGEVMNELSDKWISLNKTQQGKVCNALLGIE